MNTDNKHSTLVVEEVFENTRAFYVCEAIQEGPTLKVDSKVIQFVLLKIYITCCANKLNKCVVFKD